MFKLDLSKKITDSESSTSATSRIIIQLVWLTTLVILPQLFPEIIQTGHKSIIAVNIFLVFCSTIFFEVLKIVLIHPPTRH